MKLPEYQLDWVKIVDYDYWPISGPDIFFCISLNIWPDRLKDNTVMVYLTKNIILLNMKMHLCTQMLNNVLNIIRTVPCIILKLACFKIFLFAISIKIMFGMSEGSNFTCCSIVAFLSIFPFYFTS